MYIREGNSLSLVCTLKNISKNYEVKVDVQKIDIRYVDFIQSMFSFIIAIW